MDATFILVHSPSVGPATWAPVADRLRSSGATVLVPSLLDVADAAEPFWPRVVEVVRDAIASSPADRSVLIVAHSNAGLFVPLIVEASPRPVVGCVFVDATLPAAAAPAPPAAHPTPAAQVAAADRNAPAQTDLVGPGTPVAQAEMVDFLRSKVADDGRLPPWTSWWDEADVAPMFPDARTRRIVEAEQPRLPFAYYRQLIPVPAGWDSFPCGYLLFGPPYDQVADDARGRGWDVTHIPGHHLHELVAPDEITAHLLTVRRQWTR